MAVLLLISILDNLGHHEGFNLMVPLILVLFFLVLSSPLIYLYFNYRAADKNHYLQMLYLFSTLTLHMSENTVTISHSQDLQRGNGRRSVALILFFLYLKIMLYILIFSIPYVILKRMGYGDSPYKSIYTVITYCGVNILAILEAKRKLAVAQVMKVVELDLGILKLVGIPVSIGVFALSVIIDQSNAFVDPPDFPLLQKDGVNLFLCVLAAPVLEEILCRGIVLKFLLANTKSPGFPYYILPCFLVCFI